MEDFINASWLPVLQANNLADFEQIWQLQADWFEAPNHRRGGWSGVSCIQITDANGKTIDLFLKRQQNHSYKPFGLPWRSAPTFRREMRNMLRYMHYGIPIAEPIYYAERKADGLYRAILITASIAPEYRSLESLYNEWSQQGFPSVKERHKIIQAIAKAARKLHQHYLRHGSLAFKHVFVKYQPGQPVAVKFIDLEKSRYWLIEKRRVGNDLSALGNEVSAVSLSDKLRFYKEYLGIERLTHRNARLQRVIAKRVTREQVKRKK
jgi:hypothetical protein